MLTKLPLVVALLVGLAQPAAANPYADQLTRLIDAELREIAQDPILIAALRARNAEPDLSAAEIDSLDRAWRASVGAADAPLIAAISASPASARLVAAQAASDGLLTEVFATDRQGLNVAMSEVTSDYWQGDEAKWSETFAIGADAVHLSDVEFDESAQVFQVQVSFTVTDPDTGAPIGAITFGVNAEMLN